MRSLLKSKPTPPLETRDLNSLNGDDAETLAASQLLVAQSMWSGSIDNIIKTFALGHT